MSKKIPKKSKSTYDTDRYEFSYSVTKVDGRVVWEVRPEVGPDAYNNSHIDLLLDTFRNSSHCVNRHDNPYYRNGYILSSENAKFKP